VAVVGFAVDLCTGHWRSASKEERTEAGEEHGSEDSTVAPCIVGFLLERCAPGGFLARAPTNTAPPPHHPPESSSSAWPQASHQVAMSSPNQTGPLPDLFNGRPAGSQMHTQRPQKAIELKTEHYHPHSVDGIGQAPRRLPRRPRGPAGGRRRRRREGVEARDAVRRRDDRRRRHAADPHAPPAAGLRRPPGPARPRAVRQLAVRRGDQLPARLAHHPGPLREVRRQLHDGRPLPERLPRRHRRGHRLRRGPAARRQREGGVGVRHRRDHALQPPLLRQARLRVRTYGYYIRAHADSDVSTSLCCI
jgi:hypothetical protein